MLRQTHWIATAVISMVLLGGTATVFAVEPVKIDSRAAVPPDELIVNGVILSVDTLNKSFLFKITDGAELTLTYTEVTKIIVNGKEPSPQHLKPNAKAVVSHNGGVASMISISQ